MYGCPPPPTHPPGHDTSCERGTRHEASLPMTVLNVVRSVSILYLSGQQSRIMIKTIDIYLDEVVLRASRLDVRQQVPCVRDAARYRDTHCTRNQNTAATHVSRLRCSQTACVRHGFYVGIAGVALNCCLRKIALTFVDHVWAHKSICC